MSNLPALTFLNLSCCSWVTDEGVRAVSNLSALKTCNLYACIKLTDEHIFLRNSTNPPPTLNLSHHRSLARR